MQGTDGRVIGLDKKLKRTAGEGVRTGLVRGREVGFWAIVKQVVLFGKEGARRVSRMPEGAERMQSVVSSTHICSLIELKRRSSETHLPSRPFS